MKIFVGLSGGVDSSVAAALLQQQGYSVMGVYMKNWTQDLPGVECPWREDLADARAVASKLDIPFRIYDFEKEYRDRVVEYLVSEYKAGRTPNPDIMCNQEIKFKLFLDAALADGANAIATGHYARTLNGQLMRGLDDNKDQTYFLYRITQDAIRRSFMPIGEYTKVQVRELAEKLKLPTARKKDSQGICFVGPIGMKAFLAQYVQVSPGKIIHNKQVIGHHDGAIFYTIGQRQGLGVGGGRPFYVIGKDMDKNEVIVTDDSDDLELQTDTINLKDTHWINGEPEPGKNYKVRLRHRGELLDCAVEKLTQGKLKVKLEKMARAIAVGQSAVIYDGSVVLGGGIISVTALGKSVRPNHEHLKPHPLIRS